MLPSRPKTYWPIEWGWTESTNFPFIEFPRVALNNGKNGKDLADRKALEKDYTRTTAPEHAVFARPE